MRAALTRLGAGDFLGAIVAWRQVAPANPRDLGVFRARPLFDRLLGFGSPSTPVRAGPPVRPPNAVWTALRAGDLAHARRLVEGQSDLIAADGVLGVIDVLERRPAQAIERLDRAIEQGDPSYRKVLRAHRVRALIHLRRFSDVPLALEAVNEEESFGVRVLRALMQTQADREIDTPQFSRAHVERPEFINGVFCTELPAVVGQRALDEAYGSRESMRSLLEAVLDRLAGNLESPPTVSAIAADGSRSCVPLVLPPTERQRAVDALDLVRRGDQALVESALDALVAEAPRSASFVCHRGELRLWTGRYAEAAHDFQTARTLSAQRLFRWADIGEMAALLFEGRLAEAARLADHPDPRLTPVRGGTLPVYRGALRRRRGDLDAAIADLGDALDAKPSRMGARMELCLALRAAGRASEATPHAAEILRVAAPLVVDVAEQLKLDWGANPSLLIGDDTLERALVAMRGNRSSSIFSWFDGTGRMRVLQSPESLKASAARELGALR